MRVGGAAIAAAALIAAVSISLSAQTRPIAYPGTSWGIGDPQQMGWSTAKLEEAHAFVQTLPPSSVLIIDGGRVVATWGNPSLRIKISSTRKSLLSALYGIYVANGTVVSGASSRNPDSYSLSFPLLHGQ